LSRKINTDQKIPVITSLSIFINAFWKDRGRIPGMVWWDFKKRYLSSFIGVAWGFIQPAMSLLIIGLAMRFGLKMGRLSDGTPYTPWLICGMIPWLFISESLHASTNSLLEYGYLIKKTSFNVSIIPFVKVMTGLLTHFVMLIFAGIYLWMNDITPGIAWLQLPYLISANTLLMSALGWLLSSAHVFIRDIGTALGIMITLLLWATPILWPADVLSPAMKPIAWLNPFHHITDGYRKTLLHNEWIFSDITGMISFWLITLSLLAISMLVFRRLNNHFADVI
jgi:ABC-type polysaccharide/polyol phosphate export permease